MTISNSGIMTPGPTLIVEDNAFLSTEIHEALHAAGFEPLAPAGDYPSALATLSKHTPRLCVLDLDLGRQLRSNVPIGEEGRRLLAVLRARGCRTLVYSAYLANEIGLNEIAPDAELLSKSQPVEEVVRALWNISRRFPAAV